MPHFTDALFRRVRAALQPRHAFQLTDLVFGVVGLGLLMAFQPERKTQSAEPIEEKRTFPKDVAEPARERTDFFGDPLPNEAVARLGTLRFRHDGWVMHAAWSPDGRFVVSSAGLTVIVWDARTGREFDRLTLAKSPKKDQSDFGLDEVSALAWSPAGNQVLAAYGPQLHHWKWDANKNTFGLHESWPKQVAWNGLQYMPDGRTILCESAGTLEQISAVDGKSIRTFKSGAKSLDAFSLSSNGKMLATASENEQIKLWNTESGAPLRALPSDGKISQLCFSSDGKQVAAGCSFEGKSFMQVWETSGKSVIRIEYPSRKDGSSDLRHILFSPDNRELVSASADHTVRWWDLETGKEKKKIGPLPNPLLRVAYRADGKVLMTVCPENHIRLWDMATDKELPLAVGPAWAAHAAAFTPDGRKALISSFHAVHVYDSITGKEYHQLTGQSGNHSRALVTPDGKTAIAGGVDGKILFWDLETGKEVRRLQVPKFAYLKMALSPDGKQLAIAEGEPTRLPILIWDVASGTQIREIALPPKPELYAIDKIGFTRDGGGVYIGSGTDLHVPIFEVATGRLLDSLQKTNGGLNAADLTVDGRVMAAATMGESLYFWEMATGKQRLVLNNAGYITDVAWSPNGRVLAVLNNGRHSSRGSGDETIENVRDRNVVRLIDPFSGKELHRFVGHRASVQSLVWSPDGKRLLSGSDDTTGLIWEVPAWMYLPLKEQEVELPKSEKLWEQLGSDDSEAAYQAIGKLIRSPGISQALIRGKIKPVGTPDAGAVQKWVNDLDHDKFSIRDNAAKELKLLGECATPDLEAILAGNPSAEARSRIERLLTEMKSSRILFDRALEVLERAGDKESLKILKELAQGNQKSWLTKAAKDALKRGGQW